MKLLQEFIRLNVNELFGLDRRVTMNALIDVIGGPGQSYRVNDQNIYVVDDVLQGDIDDMSIRNLSNESFVESSDDLDDK